MLENSIRFWISHKMKCISFHEEIGFEKINVDTNTEMWEVINLYLNNGYLVM